jgi:hypothetical protein
MTNRKIANHFEVTINGVTNFVMRDSSEHPENWVRTDENGTHFFTLDPTKYVAIKMQVNKINRFYRAVADERLAELFDGLHMRLESAAREGKRITQLEPKKWVTR